MHKKKWQWFCVILFVVVGCTKKEKDAQEVQVNKGDQEIFKFSISFEQMQNEPRKSQVIVEKELAPDLEKKKYDEMDARNKLALGFEALGDFESAAKNYLRCEALSKDATDVGDLFSVCLLGAARVVRFSSFRGEIARLYDLRNSPLIAPNLKIQIYTELINSFSFKREFANAKKLVAEAEKDFSKLNLLDQYMLRYSQALMLVDAKEFGAASSVMKQVRTLADKLGAQFVGWVDHGDGLIHLGKKNFEKAKLSYEKAVTVIGKKDSQFNAFWVNYLGLKIGFYLKDQGLIDSGHKACKSIIKGSEIEKQLLLLIDGWVKLAKRTDITTDLKTLNQSLGGETNLVEELNAAKAWQKSN